MAVNKYTIEFKDAKERTVLVEITNSSIVSGTTKELQAAASPLTISEDSDLDPMKPLRSSVARITVVCGYEDLIPVQDDLQWAVKVKLSGTVVWQGWLRTDLPDASLSSVPGEILYVADDIIGSLAARNKTLFNERTALKNLIEITYDFIDNSIPVTDYGQAPWTTMNNLSVQGNNWKEYVENDEGIQEVKTDKAGVVEEDIAAFLGVCARSWKNHYFLGSIFGTKFYESSVERIYDIIDGSAFTWTGFHTVKGENGIGLISLESGGRIVESKSMPSISNGKFVVKSIGYMHPQTSHVSYGLNCYQRLLAPAANSGISFVEKTNTEGTPLNILGQLGCHIADIDVWNEDGGEIPTNFSFTRCCLFVGKGLNGNGNEPSLPSYTATSTIEDEAINTARSQMMNALLQSTPLLTIHNEVIDTKDGGFTLKIDRREMTIEKVVVANFNHRELQEIGGTSSPMGVLFTLRYGEYYWTGLENWSNQSTPILLFYGNGTPHSGQVNHMKTIDDLFNGEGMSMPTPGIMSGDVELRIYGIYNVTDTQDIVGSQIVYTATWAAEDIVNLEIKLAYNQPLNLLDIQQEEKFKCSQNTAGFPEGNEKSVELSVCSDADIVQNWGWVYNGNNIVKTLHWPKLRQYWKPERFVLKRNTLALSRNRQYATMNIECEYDDLPFRRVSFLGRTWYPLACKMDMQTCHSELLMFDITDIMAELPAVGTDEGSVGGSVVIVVSPAGHIVSLTLSEELDEDVEIEWSTAEHSGSFTIPAGEEEDSFDAGETIHEYRDLSIRASAESYTFDVQWEY